MHCPVNERAAQIMHPFKGLAKLISFSHARRDKQSKIFCDTKEYLGNNCLFSPQTQKYKKPFANCDGVVRVECKVFIGKMTECLP